MNQNKMEYNNPESSQSRKPDRMHNIPGIDMRAFMGPRRGHRPLLSRQTTYSDMLRSPYSPEPLRIPSNSRPGGIVQPAFRFSSARSVSDAPADETSDLEEEDPANPAIEEFFKASQGLPWVDSEERNGDAGSELVSRPESVYTVGSYVSTEKSFPREGWYTGSPSRRQLEQSGSPTFDGPASETSPRDTRVSHASEMGYSTGSYEPTISARSSPKAAHSKSKSVGSSGTIKTNFRHSSLPETGFYRDSGELIQAATPTQHPGAFTACTPRETYGDPDMVYVTKLDEEAAPLTKKGAFKEGFRKIKVAVANSLKVDLDDSGKKKLAQAERLHSLETYRTAVLEFRRRKEAAARRREQELASQGGPATTGVLEPSRPVTPFPSGLPSSLVLSADDPTSFFSFHHTSDEHLSQESAAVLREEANTPWPRFGFLEEEDELIDSVEAAHAMIMDRLAFEDAADKAEVSDEEEAKDHSLGDERRVPGDASGAVTHLPHSGSRAPQSHLHDCHSSSYDPQLGAYVSRPVPDLQGGLPRPHARSYESLSESDDSSEQSFGFRYEGPGAQAPAHASVPSLGFGPPSAVFDSSFGSALASARNHPQDVGMSFSNLRFPLPPVSSAAAFDDASKWGSASLPKEPVPAPVVQFAAPPSPPAFTSNPKLAEKFRQYAQATNTQAHLSGSNRYATLPKRPSPAIPEHIGWQAGRVGGPSPLPSTPLPPPTRPPPPIPTAQPSPPDPRSHVSTKHPTDGEAKKRAPPPSLQVSKLTQLFERTAAAATLPEPSSFSRPPVSLAASASASAQGKGKGKQPVAISHATISSVLAPSRSPSPESELQACDLGE